MAGLLLRWHGEGLGQDGLAQRLGALEIGLDLGFDAADDGEAAVDFGDDAPLLVRWRHRHANGSDEAQIQVRLNSPEAILRVFS